MKVGFDGTFSKRVISVQGFVTPSKLLSFEKIVALRLVDVGGIGVAGIECFAAVRTHMLHGFRTVDSKTTKTMGNESTLNIFKREFLSAAC